MLGQPSPRPDSVGIFCMSLIIETGTIYLIHFEKAFARKTHYIGWAPDSIGLTQRIEKHRNGCGAKLLKSVNNAKIEWNVVRTWKDRTLADEAALKEWKNAKKLCPLCWSSNPDNLQIGNPTFN